jgi:hypothetical protein
VSNYLNSYPICAPVSVLLLNWAGVVTGIFGWEDLLGTLICNFVNIASITDPEKSLQASSLLMILIQFVLPLETLFTTFLFAIQGNSLE